MLRGWGGGEVLLYMMEMILLAIFGQSGIDIGHFELGILSLRKLHFHKSDRKIMSQI